MLFLLLLLLFLGLCNINDGFIFRSFSNSKIGYTSSSRSSRAALFDDSIDISADGGVSKKLKRRGDARKGYPLIKDSVEIAWKIYLQDGSLVHDSAVSLEEEFTFRYALIILHITYCIMYDII